MLLQDFKNIYLKPIKYKIYVHCEIYVLYINKYMELSSDQIKKTKIKIRNIA